MQKRNKQYINKIIYFIFKLFSIYYINFKIITYLKIFIKENINSKTYRRMKIKLLLEFL